MDSTYVNSESLTTIEESNYFILIVDFINIEDFMSSSVINGENEIKKFILDSRNILIKCLGSIKQNYDYYLNIRDILDNIINKIEEIILFTYLFKQLTIEQEMDYYLKILTKYYELFIVLFKYTTSNSFLESFFNIFKKFLKKIEKFSLATQQNIMKYFSHFNTNIYQILIDKKIEYIDKLRDSKISVNVIKVIYILLDKIHLDVFKEAIIISNLFNFLNFTKNNIFALSNDIYLDKVSDYIYKIMKKVLIQNKEANCRKLEEEIEKVTLSILTKMLEIARYKDDLKNAIDYSQEIFYVNSLILCLKQIKLIFKRYPSIISNPEIKDLITKNLIELSFWDSYTIVDLTCNLFQILWKTASNLDISMRSNFEKIIDYLFVRRYQSYYSILKDNENSNIKLSTIEIITKYLNKLIEESDFLITSFFTYDFSKIRYNMIGEIFNSIQKYYTLEGNKFTFLKKQINITYLVTLNKIMKGEGEINNEHIKTHQNLTEFWQGIIKTINAGKFKKFYEKIIEIFNVKLLDKKSDLKNEPLEIQNEYTNISKSIANLVKFSYQIDINILYETISDNHTFSQAILDHYCNTFNFQGLDLLKAYEVYVSTFKLYGEPHNIYNFLMKFSKKYFDDNHQIENCPFETEDQVSTLAYSILMLNTDLHNPNLTKHMLMEEFINNNRSTKLYDNFPVEYFKNIYKSISTNPLKVANSRKGDYSKSDEIYHNIRNNQYYSNKSKEENILNYDFDDKNFNLINFPNVNIHEEISLNYYNLNTNTLYFIFWEEFFYNIMTMPNKFYELKDENTLAILEKVCQISDNFAQKENIDKLIVKIKYNFR